MTVHVLSRLVCTGVGVGMLAWMLLAAANDGAQ